MRTTFYRALLHLYPASFRREYGGEMVALFAMRSRQATGIMPTVVLWSGTLVEVLGNAVAAHWDILRQDLRYTVRTLARSPGFAITAILVTALGVGANTAAFSVADFVLIRPLPFPEPDRLVNLWERPPGYRMELSPPNYRDWKAMSNSFEAMGAFHGEAANLVGQGEPERVTGVAATADLLPLLGVSPALGRVFTAEEERSGADGTVVLSDGLWRRSFGGDSGVLGRRVLMDGNPRVIIGVMPGAFHFPNRSVAFWIPMPLSQQNSPERDDNWFQAVARLKRGVTLQQARAEMSVIAAQLERRYPRENEKVGALVNGLREELSTQSRLLLVALCGASVCVLL
ncbi:MAG TPA: ABC transporter permease, partial [Gemmatimonadaceae bacterium]|nr:ABC transporter permease [Gemmatimonadaceae bacterium]